LFYEARPLLFDVRHIALASLLCPAAWVDWKAYKIPNLIILMGIVYWGVIVGVELLTGVPGALWSIAFQLIAAGLVAGVVFLAGFLSKNGVGFGDIKLLILLCLLLGMDGIWSALFLSLLIAFVTALVLLITKRKQRKDMMAFAPAIMIGTYLSIVLTGM
jgi:leader peptidase (prepilin peptidase)/N-methyltransferase